MGQRNQREEKGRKKKDRTSEIFHIQLCQSSHATEQALANFFHKGSDRKYFRFWGSYILCCNYSSCSIKGGKQPMKKYGCFSTDFIYENMWWTIFGQLAIFSWLLLYSKITNHSPSFSLCPSFNSPPPSILSHHIIYLISLARVDLYNTIAK